MNIYRVGVWVGDSPRGLNLSYSIVVTVGSERSLADKMKLKFPTPEEEFGYIELEIFQIFSVRSSEQG